MTVVFYTSGHGFGHATRDIEVVHAVLARRPHASIVVRTNAPRGLFSRSTRTAIEVQTAEVDTGVVQIDSLCVDEDETARRAASFYADLDRRADDEAGVIRRLGATVVVADIPPLAFAAARRAGVPAVALANFTWDWIYGGYPGFERSAPGVIETIRAAYSYAALALRLPFHGGFDTMSTVVADIPLVARKSRWDREAVRRELHLPSGRPVVLASFGAYGVPLPFERIAASGAFTLVVTGDRESPSFTPAGAVESVLFVPLETMARRGIYYQDLVSAADVVVSKPGYGIVSECIANGAALVYTSRGRFIEQEILLAEMPRVLRCRFISPSDLREGRWDEAVEEVLGLPSAPACGIDGATVAAERILACV